MKKLMKNFVCILLAAILILGCFPVFASAATTYTLEQKQNMIVQTALAYYYHNPYVQYDGKETTANGKLARHSDKGAPEDADVDSQVYSVCSGFCWKCYEDALDYQLFGMTYARTRTWAALETELSSFYKNNSSCVIYQYVGEYGRNTEAHGGKELRGETNIEKALVDSRKLLVPGDIIVYATKTGGHAMLFVGDCLGDGKEYILHCWGSSYDDATFKDKYEPEGSIKLQVVDDACYGDSAKPNCFLGSKSHSDWGFAILRPLNDPVCAAKTPQPKAVSRIQYPYLEAWRALDRNKFQPAHTGEEIPVTVTIKNNGKTAYSNLPVEEYLPAGQTLVADSATSGVTVTGSTLKWNLNIPAGQTKTLTYKVKLGAKMGETVTFPHGKVGDIPTRQTTLTMGGTTLTNSQKSVVSSYGNGENGKSTTPYRNLDYFNQFYKKSLGIDINLPATAETLWKGLCSTKDVAISKVNYKFSYWKTSGLTAEQKRWKQMVLPLHLTGRYVDNVTIGTWDRVRDHNAGFYEPGDLFLGVNGTDIVTDIKTPESLELCVYLGNSKMLYYDCDGKSTVKTFGDVMDYALKYSLLMVLRPSLAQCFDHSAIDHVEAVPATCTQSGLKEYWQCPACESCFADSKGTAFISELAAWKTGDGFVAKQKHSLQKTAGIPATCTSTGIADYWQCDSCKHYFSDPAGLTEITDFSTWERERRTTSKLPHQMVSGVCRNCGFALVSEDPEVVSSCDVPHAFVAAYGKTGKLLYVGNAEKDGKAVGITLPKQFDQMVCFLNLYRLSEYLAPTAPVLQKELIHSVDPRDNEMPIL